MSRVKTIQDKIIQVPEPEKKNLLWFLTIIYMHGINILVSNSEHVAQVCRETI